MSGVDIAVSVVAKLLEYIAQPILQPFDYIIHHDRNINRLRTQITCLENTRFGYQQQVDVATRNGDIVLPVVQDWINKATALATESHNLLSDCDHSCPHLKLMYKTSRDAKKKRMAVSELLESGKFDIFSHPAHLPSIWPSNNADGFESRKGLLRLVMEALVDDSVNVIGVYGMGGIGKTTFVEQVAKQADANQLFDEMVMVVVSHKPNLRKLQGDLAEMLELNLKEEGVLLRTARLRERLNQVKRILIILDDVWTPLDLRTIGIPQSKGCKIILTSRSLDVCNAMNTERNFHMDVLSQAESWNLFRKMAGDTVDSDDLNPIATKVAKRCSGLPLAIVTVARALRYRSKHAWCDALRQLRSSTMNNVKGMYASVFASLELSFNFLKDEEAKSCFLLCSLFKEDLDIPFEYLVRYGTGLRVFQDVHSLEEARDRVHTIVENLKACCLFLDSDVEECFRMHDVTRDFLLSVASKGLYIFLEKTMPGYINSPNENKFRNAYAISLVLNDLEEFPVEINCPNLQLWRLEGSLGFVEFSGNFLDGLKELKVVLMHHVSIPLIPSSFLVVRKLLTLCLEHCKLGDLSQIKELKHLEILSFKHSDIESLPKEIGELSRLRLLDLADCRNLSVIPFGVFSKLSNLECLYMLNSFVQWGFEGQNQATLRAQHLILDYSIINYLEDLNSIVYDLRKGFRHLRCLEVYGYTGVESLIDTNIFPVLEKLKVVSAADLKMICYDHLPDQSFCELQELMLSILPELTCLWMDPLGNVCLHNLRTLFVSDCHKLKDLLSQSTAKDLSQLQKLYVSSCENLNVILYKDQGVSSSQIVLSNLKSIKLEFLPTLRSFCSEAYASLASDDIQEPLFNSKVDFPSLEELTLRELHSVKKIWRSQLSAANFRSLRILIIFWCDSLVLVFPSYMQYMLRNLEILSIEWCDSVEEVCKLHNENDAQIAALPCVRDLNLGKLPLMKHLWWDGGPHAYTSLQNLNSLHIYECDALIHLFSGEDSVIVLSELCSVKLDDLPELLTFSQGSTSLEFPSLDMIEIKSCPKMKVFVDSDVRQEGNHGIISRPLFNEKVALPNLQALYLNGLNSLDGIWHTQLPDKSFSKLQVINVMNCGQLMVLGPLNMLPRLQLLEVIQVTNCASLEQILTLKHPQIQKYISSVSLINLVDLVLENLPNLRQIWWDRTPNHTHRFPRLAAIEVESCDRLDCIFPASVARGVPQLQKLKVYKCMSLKAIVGNNGQDLDPTDMILPQICSIELENLPNVVVFCTRMSVLRWLSLKELRIVSCPKMGSFISTSSLHGEGSGGFLEENLSNNIQGFFTEKIVFPSLEKLRVDNLECVDALWHTDTIAESFRQLRVLEVRNCDNLLKLIPSSLLSRMHNLEELHVNQCRLLENIVEKLEEDLGENVILPKLHTIQLINLPKLASFFSGNRSFEWPNLERFAVEDCPSMKTFSSVVQIVPKLNAVEVGYGLQCGMAI
nr:probable disease resistance protein At1g12280 [Tanacetum cinerariifolium]